ncbi:acyltransferase [soil metagenome]
MVETLSPVPPRPAAKPVELWSIQYLRAAAALGVVVWHAQGQVGLHETAVLQAGIEVFFIISGLVMWLILEARPTDPVTFLKKRLIRIVPLYWVLTTVMVALLLLAPRLLQSTRFDLPHVIASYLFVAWPNPVAAAGLKPVMIPGWTLNYEMAFYGLLAVGLCLKTPRRGPFLLGVLALLTLLSLVPMTRVAHFYASPFMAEFAIGIALAMGLKRAPAWLRSRPRLMFMTGLGTLILGGALDPTGQVRLVSFALPAALIVAGLTVWEQAGSMPRIPVLKAIGDASYPLYMIHPVLLSALVQAWKAGGLEGLPPWLFVGLGLVVTCGVGWIAHVTLERPLAALFQPRPRSALPRLKTRTATEG